MLSHLTNTRSGATSTLYFSYTLSQCTAWVAHTIGRHKTAHLIQHTPSWQPQATIAWLFSARDLFKIMAPYQVHPSRSWASLHSIFIFKHTSRTRTRSEILDSLPNPPTPGLPPGSRTHHNILGSLSDPGLSRCPIHWWLYWLIRLLFCYCSQNHKQTYKNNPSWPNKARNIRSHVFLFSQCYFLPGLGIHGRWPPPYGGNPRGGKR